MQARRPPFVLDALDERLGPEAVDKLPKLGELAKAAREEDVVDFFLRGLGEGGHVERAGWIVLGPLGVRVVVRYGRLEDRWTGGLTGAKFQRGAALCGSDDDKGRQVRRRPS